MHIDTDTAQDDANSRLLTTDEAAAYLGFTPGWLVKLRNLGGGPRYSKLGDKVRYRRRWLDAWIDKSSRNSTSDD
jgi:hypothetical protein